MLKKIALIILAPVSIASLLMTGSSASAKEISPHQQQISPVQSKSSASKMVEKKQPSAVGNKSSQPTPSPTPSTSHKHKTHPTTSTQSTSTVKPKSTSTQPSSKPK